MKQCKTILLLTLTAALLLTMAACGGSDTAQQPSPTPGVSTAATPDTSTPAPTPTPTPEATPEATPTPTPEATPAPTPEQNASADPKATAESLIGSDVSALYAAIGYPTGSSYAPSCLGDGEDGELYYDGFTVYTYRENGVETISVVL